MITDNFLFLRGPNPSVYILVLVPRSTGASAIREILSGRTQRTLTISEVLEEDRANVLKRLRKRFLPSNYGLSKAALEEIKKHTLEEIELPPTVIRKLYTLDLTPDEVELFLREAAKDRQVEHEVKTAHGTIIALGDLKQYTNEDDSAPPIALLRKGDVSKEWGTREQGDEEDELAKPQALEKIGASGEQIISSPDLPDAVNKTVSFAEDIYNGCKKGVSLEEIKETLQQKAQALPRKGDVFSPQPKQEKPLQPPDLSEIPLYQGRRGRRKQGSPPEVRPLDFLKTHYGQWLSIFGAEENIVFQDQIRAHDPDLIKGIDNQLRREGEGRKVRDFVKTRSARADRELENVSVEDLKRKPRLAATLYGRGKRAADKAKSSASRSS